MNRELGRRNVAESENGENKSDKLRWNKGPGLIQFKK
jgi:hypothetical protein